MIGLKYVKLATVTTLIALVLLSLAVKDCSQAHALNRDEAAAPAGPATSKFKYRIAVIDSGITPEIAGRVPLCPKGHFDFTRNLPGVASDELLHGSLVSQLIDENAGRQDYCQIILKIATRAHPDKLYKWTLKALKYIERYNVKAINMSYEGSLHPTRMAKERILMKELGARGTRMFVAAGNGSINLNEQCSVAPACYKEVKNMLVVGGLSSDGMRAASSNFGSIVDLWMPGFVMFSNGQVKAGTSFAAPRALGAYLRGLP